jgi:hypothetical protein
MVVGGDYRHSEILQFRLLVGGSGEKPGPFGIIVTKITQNHDLCLYLNTVPRVLKTRRMQALETGGVMTRIIRGAGLVIIAAVLAGCGSNAAGSPGPASSTAAPQTVATVSAAGKQAGAEVAAGRVCQQPGKYLTAVRTGKHPGYDRVVFQFSGGVPVIKAERAKAIYADPKGTKISLPGRFFLHVVFRGASGFCPQPSHRTWTGPSALTPRYPQLLAVKAAGDFEGYLSFGLGLAAKGPYHVSTLTGPDRVVIDVSHVASR